MFEESAVITQYQPESSDDFMAMVATVAQGGGGIDVVEPGGSVAVHGCLQSSSGTRLRWQPPPQKSESPALSEEA